MTKYEFRKLFEGSLETAALNADEQLKTSIPRNFKVLLNGAGHSKELMDVNNAANAIYISERLFYKIVDIAVVEVGRDYTMLFVRVSDHKPGRFEESWNNPKGSGPFKQIIAQNIKVTVND